MFEALSLVLFAGVIYFCLVVAPSCVEYFKCNDCKEACFGHASNK